MAKGDLVLTPPARGRPAAQGKRRSRAAPSPWLGIVGVVAFLLAWEMLARTASPLFIVPVAAVPNALKQQAQNGALWTDLLISLRELGIGFAIALGLGIPLGIILGWSPLLFAAANPFVTAANTVPRIALLPLVIIMFGLGIWSKVTIVALGAVLPILYNMIEAMRSLDLRLLRMARSFGAGDAALFRTVALPFSVPFLVSAIRIAIGRGMTGLITAELVAATAGLGFRMQEAATFFHTGIIYAYMVVIAMIALVLDYAARLLERRAASWRLQSS